MSQAGLFEVYLTLLAIDLLEYWPQILKHCISEKKKRLFNVHWLNQA